MVDTWLKNRRELFWDINEKDIPKSFVDSKEWVVLRVFEYGTLEDIAELINFYGQSDVKEILIKNKLPPVTKVMAFMFLDVKSDTDD